MKVSVLAALLTLPPGASHAAAVDNYGAMVQRQSPVCVFGGPTISRTAFLPGAATPCCDGQVQCNQLLATTKIDRPRRALHS